MGSLPTRSTATCAALSEAASSVHSTFFLHAFVIPAHVHSAWQKWRLIYSGALTPDKKEDGIFNSSKKCEIKLPVSSYQTGLNTSGSPPSKHRILQSQFSSPVWCCWRYLAGWLLRAGKKQDTEFRKKKLAGLLDSQNYTMSSTENERHCFSNMLVPDRKSAHRRSASG